MIIVMMIILMVIVPVEWFKMTMVVTLVVNQVMVAMIMILVSI